MRKQSIIKKDSKHYSCNGNDCRRNKLGRNCEIPTCGQGCGEDCTKRETRR